MKQKNIELTSGEIGGLWTSYMNNTASTCFLKYFKETVEDKDINKIVVNALKRTENSIKKIKDILADGKLAIPQGFTEDDVILGTPKLFSDTFVASFIYNMSVLGSVQYSYGLSLATRDDVRDLFNYLIDMTQENQNESVKVSLHKGFHIKPPYIVKPTKINFVQSPRFLTEKRPINAIEIGHIFTNILNNSIGKSLMIAFSQIAKSEEVTKMMIRGKEIAAKHIEIFTNLLEREDVEAPKSWIFNITDSTTPTFSDKLMMFFATTLMANGVGNYGRALSESLRKDLALDYSRLMAEILQYSNDAAKLMIKNGWLEEPPLSANRDKLAQK